jgi:thiol peroxidase
MLSVDTGTCAMESRTFNKHMSELGATTLLVTLDLPWGMKNFCSSEGIDKCIPASDFRFQEFSQGYHLVMQNGPLAGILGRMVLVLDKQGVIRYTELVPIIGDEPDYDAAIAAVKELL